MRKNTLLNGFVSIVIMALFSIAAQAHEQDAGPNGGAFTDIGSHHLELVLTKDTLKLFVTGWDESPIDVSDATGNAIILAGTKKSTAKLSPANGHIMESAVAITKAGPYTIVVIVKLASGEGLQAKFKVNELLAAKAHNFDHNGHNTHAQKAASGDNHSGHATHKHGSTIHVATKSISDFAANTPVNVVLTINDKETKEPLSSDDFKIAHTRKVHLLIIDPSFDDYHHVHPMPGETKGEWKFSFTPKTNSRYYVWADVLPVSTGAQEYVAFHLNHHGKNNINVGHDTIYKAQIDSFDYHLNLSKPLEVGQSSEATVIISDENGPYKGLEPVMGAFAHMVGFTDDLESIIHIHPLGKEPETDEARGDGNLRFHLQPEKAGMVRLWLQVKLEGKEQFIPFTVKVAPEA